MLTVEDDDDGINQDNSAIDGDTNQNYDFSEKGLSRVASEIGGENVKKVIFNFITEYLKKDEWQYKLVAIVAIKQTFEYLPEEGIDAILDETVEILNVQLNNQYYRVRLATCEALSQITLDRQPEFQKSYAKEILPMLVNLFDDPSSRVQSRAVAAFINFAKGTEKADLMPFADQFMEKLLEGIKPSKPRMMREQCVKGIVVVANVIEDEFMKYYSFVVPVMKGIIIASTTKEERTIRRKAVKCISIISQSVEAEMFQSDAHEVMQALLDIASAGVEADDLMKKYIEKVFCQICHSLKGEFVPYLQHLIPNVLKVLTIEPQPVNHEEGDVKVMTIVAGGKCTGLKDSKTDEIIAALHSLLTYIEVLGAQFGEYLVPAAQSLLSLLAFSLDGRIEFLALNAIAKVLSAARELSSSDPAVRQTLSLWVSDVLENVFKDLAPHKDNDLRLVYVKTECLQNFLHNAGPGVLNAQQVSAICEKVFALMGEVVTREEYPDQALLLTTLPLIIGAVMSFHADLYLQTCTGLCSNFFETHLNPNCTPDDRALALHVCGDVLEHLKDKGAPLWPTFASRLVESIGDSDPGVRQNAAYGVFQAAKCCPHFPDELIQKAAAQLVAFLNATQSRERAFLYATDNMIGSLGAIILHRSGCLQPSPEQFLQFWISNLPLTANYETTHRVHGDFVDFLAQKSFEAVGRQNANLPKLAEICASIYQTEFSTEKIDEGIRDFMQEIGVDVISSVGANFDEKLQESLERICQDSQRYQYELRS